MSYEDVLEAAGFRRERAMKNVARTMYKRASIKIATPSVNSPHYTVYVLNDRSTKSYMDVPEDTDIESVIGFADVLTGRIQPKFKGPATEKASEDAPSPKKLTMEGLVDLGFELDDLDGLLMLRKGKVSVIVGDSDEDEHPDSLEQGKGWSWFVDEGKNTHRIPLKPRNTKELSYLLRDFSRSTA